MIKLKDVTLLAGEERTLVVGASRISDDTGLREAVRDYIVEMGGPRLIPSRAYGMWVLALRGGEVLGFGQLVGDTLVNVYVRPDCRRTGVATRMIEVARRDAGLVRANGATTPAARALNAATNLPTTQGERL